MCVGRWGVCVCVCGDVREEAVTTREENCTILHKYYLKNSCSTIASLILAHVSLFMLQVEWASCTLT